MNAPPLTDREDWQVIGGMPPDWHLSTWIMTIPPEWMSRALCLEVDPELMYPSEWSRAATAKKVCRNCPVRQDCLDYAIRIGEFKHGVWGGMTGKERCQEARRRGLEVPEESEAA